MKILLSRSTSKPLEVEEIDDVWSVKVVSDGIQVGVNGGNGEVTVRAAATDVGEGGPDCLMTEVFNINRTQAAIGFRAVNGSDHHALLRKGRAGGGSQ